MLKSLARVVVLVTAISIFSLPVVSPSEAKDLTNVLGRGLDVLAFPGGIIPLGPVISPAFSGAVAQAVAQQIPLASVAPAFTYRYNPAVDIFERATNVPGPLFSERALTLGEKQLNFSVGYAFIDFSELNGTDLNNIRYPAFQLGFLFSEATPQEAIPPGLPKPGSGQFLFFAPVIGSVNRIRLDLRAHIIVPTLRYGLTDRWDVSFSIPVLNTSLRVRRESVPLVNAPQYRFAYLGNAQRIPISPEIPLVDSAGNPIQETQLQFVKAQRPSPFNSVAAAGSATGIGDITLRSKYHFWKREEGGAALGLNLQLPTGEKRNFHGTEETHLGTFLYLSQVVGRRMEPHLNIGIDFNADDVDRSSFLYAAGATLLIGKRIGLVVDFIGRSDFAKFPVHFPSKAITFGKVLTRSPDTCTEAQPCMLERSKENPDKAREVFFPFFPEKIKRNDIVNFSFGLRYALGESGSIFFGGIVPLNSDGFRADFIPSGGIEYTF